MSAGEEHIEPKPASVPTTRTETLSAVFWLARWLGLPLIGVIALYYAEPLIRGRARIEHVPIVTRQEVHPYPFPEGAAGPNLAPPEIPRAPKPPPPLIEAPFQAPGLPAAEIVANPIDQPQPSYPRRALEQEREGSVRIKITIAPDGSVADAVVVNATSPGWFEKEALAAVRRWRYQPPGRILTTEAEIEFRLR